MTQAVELHHLKTDDLRYILSSIKETIAVIDYPTPSIFSAVTRCALVNFLKGSDQPEPSLEKGSVVLFRQLNEFSHIHDDYKWFIDWSRKLAGMVKDRRLLD